MRINCLQLVKTGGPGEHGTLYIYISINSPNEPQYIDVPHDDPGDPEDRESSSESSDSDRET